MTGIVPNATVPVELLDTPTPAEDNDEELDGGVMTASGGARTHRSALSHEHPGRSCPPWSAILMSETTSQQRLKSLLPTLLKPLEKFFEDPENGDADPLLYLPEDDIRTAFECLLRLG